MTADEYREIALGLPGSEERSHMDHPDFRVGGRIFATLNRDLTLGMVRLTPEQQQYFIRSEPTVFSPANGAWGERGATNIVLEVSNEETVRHALRSAWRNIAPKHLIPDPNRS